MCSVRGVSAYLDSVEGEASSVGDGSGVVAEHGRGAGLHRPHVPPRLVQGVDLGVHTRLVRRYCVRQHRDIVFLADKIHRTTR